MKDGMRLCVSSGDGDVVFPLWDEYLAPLKRLVTGVYSCACE